MDINGINKPKQIKLLLRSWKWRKLTLQGKITIMKTLALSKLAHLLIVLPNPPKWFTKQINTLFSNSCGMTVQTEKGARL